MLLTVFNTLQFLRPQWRKNSKPPPIYPLAASIMRAVHQQRVKFSRRRCAEKAQSQSRRPSKQLVWMRIRMRMTCVFRLHQIGKWGGVQVHDLPLAPLLSELRCRLPPERQFLLEHACLAPRRTGMMLPLSYV